MDDQDDDRYSDRYGDDSSDTHSAAVGQYRNIKIYYGTADLLSIRTSYGTDYSFTNMKLKNKSVFSTSLVEPYTDSVRIPSVSPLVLGISVYRHLSEAFDEGLLHKSKNLDHWINLMSLLPGSRCITFQDI